jgi:hypothetical protein
MNNGLNSNIFTSSNSGANWTEYKTDLLSKDIWTLEVTGNRIYAGTSNGVWKRTLPELTLSVSPTEINTVALGGTVPSLSVTSNTLWTASVDQQWLNVSPIEGIGNNSLALQTTSDNLDTVPRIARVTLSGEGTIPQTITVTQATSYIFKPKIILKWNDVLICDNNSNLFTTYQWYKNNSAIKDAVNQYYYQPGGLLGLYYVEAFNKEDRGYSNKIDIPYRKESNSFSIYPNPATTFNHLTIQLNLLNEDLSKFRITIYSIKGERIQLLENIKDRMTLQFSDQGTFIVQLQSKQGEVIQTKKIIISR